jgi:hypothetical protein
MKKQPVLQNNETELLSTILVLKSGKYNKEHPINNPPKQRSFYETKNLLSRAPFYLCLLCEYFGLLSINHPTNIGGLNYQRELKLHAESEMLLESYCQYLGVDIGVISVLNKRFLPKKKKTFKRMVFGMIKTDDRGLELKDLMRHLGLTLENFRNVHFRREYLEAIQIDVDAFYEARLHIIRELEHEEMESLSDSKDKSGDEDVDGNGNYESGDESFDLKDKVGGKDGSKDDIEDGGNYGNKDDNGDESEDEDNDSCSNDYTFGLNQAELLELIDENSEGKLDKVEVRSEGNGIGGDNFVGDGDMVDDVNINDGNVDGEIGDNKKRRGMKRKNIDGGDVCMEKISAPERTIVDVLVDEIEHKEKNIPSFSTDESEEEYEVTFDELRSTSVSIPEQVLLLKEILKTKNQKFDPHKDDCPFNEENVSALRIRERKLPSLACIKDERRILIKKRADLESSEIVLDKMIVKDKQVLKELNDKLVEFENRKLSNEEEKEYKLLKYQFDGAKASLMNDLTESTNERSELEKVNLLLRTTRNIYHTFTSDYEDEDEDEDKDEP